MAENRTPMDVAIARAAALEAEKAAHAQTRIKLLEALEENTLLITALRDINKSVRAIMSDTTKKLTPGGEG